MHDLRGGSTGAAAEAAPATEGLGIRCVAAWLAILAVSEAPEIAARAAGAPAAGLPGAKIAALTVFLLLCLAWRPLRPISRFASLLLVFLVALAGRDALGATAVWRGWFAAGGRSFTLGYLGLFLRDLLLAAVVLGALWIAFRDRRRFFFTIGDLDAPVAPVRWLGIRAGETWRKFVWIFGGAAALVVVAVTALSLRPGLADLGRAAPLLPAALLFAAINAFDEEVYFRLPLLATLPAAVGRGHAQAMNVVLFGLAHYLAGSPPGVPGVAMTGFLAWLMGKSLLETRGLFGAWLIHFLPDAVIFATYAVLWTRG